MSKHTPGPWKQVNGNVSGRWEDGTDVGIAIVGTTRFCGDDLGGPNDLRMKSEDAANARLIASAPDLLTVCKAKADVFHRIANDSSYTAGELRSLLRKWRDDLNTAIAKAEP